MRQVLGACLFLVIANAYRRGYTDGDKDSYKKDIRREYAVYD
jgi:hypothetical protein